MSFLRKTGKAEYTDVPVISFSQYCARVCHRYKSWKDGDIDGVTYELVNAIDILGETASLEACLVNSAGCLYYMVALAHELGFRIRDDVDTYPTQWSEVELAAAAMANAVSTEQPKHILQQRLDVLWPTFLGALHTLYNYFQYDFEGLDDDDNIVDQLFDEQGNFDLSRLASFHIGFLDFQADSHAK